MTLARALLATRLGRDVSFSNPRSPWQRGSNENANRLLRQYLTRRADLRQLSTRDLDNITNRTDTRPRRVLDRTTPAELHWPRGRAQYVASGDRLTDRVGQPLVLHKPAGPR